MLSNDHGSKEVTRKKTVKYEDMRVQKKPKNKKHDKAMMQEARDRIAKSKESQDRQLDLSRLDLITLPITIKDLSHLSEIYLYKNKLTKVPDEVGCLINLSTLALYENHLTALPSSLENLKLMKMLDLR